MKRARYDLFPTKLPGVWRTETPEGPAFFVRGGRLDPRTGKVREVSKLLCGMTADEARTWLVARLDEICHGASKPPRIKFADFAISVLKSKIETGRIWSPKGAEKWDVALRCHLIPAFGDYFVDAIDSELLSSWYAGIAKKVLFGKLSAATANGHLSILKQIVGTSSQLPTFCTPPGMETYTDENPNALREEDIPRFLAEMLHQFPQHFAMTLLGFTTGLRPSSMRPLRRCGPEADLKLPEGVLLIRRSQTRGEAVARTKTGRRGRIPLPKDVLGVLEWHVGNLTSRQRESELLFPSDTGGYRSGSCLDKPFTAVAEALKLPYRVTPRAMRRTFQDESRAEEIDALVTRSISGHATETMQHHYSTVRDEEKRHALERLVGRIVK
jgi:hypothetical protein